MVPGGVGGTEIYLRHLLAALAGIDSVNEYVIFTNRETGADLVPVRPNFVHEPQSVRAASRPARLLWEQTVLPLAVRRARLDVLFNPGFTCPALCSCPAVTVFHDLQHKRHPEHFRWFDLPFWRIFLYLAARRSKFLIAVSDATRKDLERFYHLATERIRVVPEGVDERLFEIGRDRAAFEAESFLLAVSTLHPHKNLDRLIRVFSRFHTDRPDFRLVIVGLRGFHAEEIEKEVQELGLGGAITLTGWIPRDQLYSLFRRAHSFVYPSTFEGFGLPVLEALAAGIPSACSAIEPLMSLAGDAALQFDPQDEDAMLEAIRRLTCDLALRGQLAQQGPRRAAAFSWKKTAEATLAALRDAVFNPRA
ncbi:MAG TPA: glycosyltransferase family 1 protein [Bryobacteraceae bacterium]|nr:glycosyltransferase family 1 protein [Bryobacteraceae bacterium]